MHAPSPITKPARVASNGRIASVGSTSSATSPRIAQKPARISGVIAASVPPARMMSAWPRTIVAAPSPIAVEPVAQAETGAKFGPVMPELDRDLAARRVDERGGDEERRDAIGAALEEDVCCCSAIVAIPPIAEPTRIPTRAGSNSSIARLVPRLLRGGDGQEDVAIHPPRLLRGHERGGVEPSHLAGDSDRELARVEALDEADAAAARDGRLPGGRRVEAERGDGSEAGDRRRGAWSGERSSPCVPWPTHRSAPPSSTRSSRSRRWRPSSFASCRSATAGRTSRSGTASAACSRTSAASCGSGRATAGRCCATSRSSGRSATSSRHAPRSTEKS